VYFALAAARFAPVRLLGIAGPDTATDYRSLLEPFPIDVSGLAGGSLPTFVWHAEHDFVRWVTARESAEPGCDPEWIPQLDAASRRAEVLFAASLDPRLQSSVLDQASAHLVGCDSMTTFMRDDAATVLSVVERSDVVFLNRDELRTLTGVESWLDAARSLVGRGRVSAVVVKAGPDGAAVVGESLLIESPASNEGDVVDPTGAGDALAGAFLGTCASLERRDPGVFERALRNGVAAASAAIRTFGLDGLLAFAGAPRSRAV
jgi:sugar/nucleoside kinase (ribokinase family)